VLPHVSWPRAAAWRNASCSGFVAVALLVGCNRNPAPPTAATPPATVNATASATATAAADPKGKAADPKAKAADPKTKAADAAAKKAAEAEKDKARQAAAERVPVETALVVRGPISAFLALNSIVETEAAVDIYPQAGGQVEELFVEEGRTVKNGDPLLKIEDRELRVDVKDATTNLEHLQGTFARIEDLYSRKLLNKQEYDDQRLQLEQARNRLERAQIRLAYTTVHAPFAGVISSRDTQVGARVGTGTKVFSIVKFDEMVVRVFVPGRYLDAVAENQPAVVSAEFLANRTFTGWVKRISPIIDPKNGTFKVTVGVRTEKLTELPPGLFVHVRIITNTRDSAVLIPKRAVVYEGGERYVFTVVDGKAVKKKLIAGYEEPLNIEALSGIEVGARVIVLGQNGLKDGVKVHDISVPPEPATAEGPKPAEPSAVKTTSTVEPAKPTKS
jgi:membrane fusion protein, multidrug efflux system